jgi:hypothetical protein
MTYNYWTCPEIERLKRVYYALDDIELQIAFPRHPLSSIRNSAQKLGMSRRHKKWLDICAAHKPTVVIR